MKNTRKNTNDQKTNNRQNKTRLNESDRNEGLKENSTNAINEGNLVNSGRTRNRTELHTKNIVLGSDSDGQAD
jgi:hypothetical protein